MISDIYSNMEGYPSHEDIVHTPAQRYGIELPREEAKPSGSS